MAVELKCKIRLKEEIKRLKTVYAGQKEHNQCHVTILLWRWRTGVQGIMVKSRGKKDIGDE
jgi:hypothetical protein